MPRPPSPSAAEQTIATALATYPPTIRADESLVLTAYSPLWTRRQALGIREGGAEVRGLPHLVDVKSLLGADAIIQIGGDFSRKERVATAVAEAGWAASRIAYEYRPDWKSAVRFDAAVLDEEGNPFLIVEDREGSSQDVVNAANEQLAAYGLDEDVPWFGLRLGDRDWVLFRGDDPDQRRSLEAPPTPADCGAGDRADLVDGFRESVLEPTSFGELQELVVSRGVRKVILDSTLPWRSHVNQRQIAPDLLDAVPKLAEQLKERDAPLRHSLDPILAWTVGTPVLEHAAAAFPLSYLVARSRQWFRQLSASQLAPAAVVECGTGGVFKHSSVQVALGYFSTEQDETFFCSLSSIGETEALESSPCFRALAEWFDGGEPEQGYITQLSLDAPWTFAANDPEIHKTRDRLARLGELSPLSEHFQITRGSINPNDLANSSQGDEELPLLGARDIGRGRLLDDSERVLSLEDIPESSQVRPGDFLVSDFLKDGVLVAQYNRPDPAAISRRVIRLRPRGSTACTAYLNSYLSSPAVDRLLRAQVRSFTDSVPRLKVSELRDLPIPHLDYEAIGEVEDIEDLERDLRRRAENVAESRRSLFDARGPDEFERKARNLRDTSSMLSAGLKLADSLDYKIRNFYPYPLAFPYRAISAETSLRGRYQEQLRFAENLLAFLGSLSLSILEPSDQADIAEKVEEEWVRGITPGGWHDLAGSACNLLSQYEDHRLAKSLHRLQVRSGKRGIGPILNDFVETKNDFKHDRGPTSNREYEAGNAELKTKIEEALEQLSFLSEFPIRQVIEMDTDRQGSNMILGCLRYTGDHPGLPYEHVRMAVETYAQQPVKKGDLYVDLGESYWRPLRPFLVSRDCPKCGSREVYFLDKLDTSRGEALLKSFERGHTIDEREDFVEDVLSWGA